MKIADRYILRQLITGFTLILVSLTTLVWLTQSLRMIDMIVTKGVSVGIFLKLTVLALPNFIQILMPLALFAVILFVFIRMQSDKELMVLKAVGMSSKQLIQPVLKMACVLTLIGYLFSFFVIPWATTTSREMKWKIQNNLSQVLLKEGQFNTFKKGMMLYVRERLPDGMVKGVLAYEMKDGKKTTLIADEGTLFQTPEGLDIVFGQGTRQEYDYASDKFSILKFDKYTISLNENQHSNQRTPNVRELPFLYLIQAKSDQVSVETVWRKYKVEAIKRLTQPLYNFVFALLALVGVLLGHYNRRGQTGRINMVVLAALLIQTFALAFENMAGKKLWCVGLMLANIIIPLWVIKRLFYRESRGMSKKILLFLVLLLGAKSGWAIIPVNANLDEKTPIDFEADKMEYDTNSHVVTAKGHVILNQNGVVFKTDKILYYQDENRVDVPNQATMTLPDGNSSVIRDIQLYPETDEIVINQPIVDLIDGTHISAGQAIRKNKGLDHILRDAAYTPCDMCEDESPLWRLRATSLAQNEDSHMMHLWNTRLEVKDIPVFYFPYFQMPDSTIKRQTGFLTPTIGSDKEMDNFIKAPFFINMSDNQNLTITPVVSFTQNPLGIVDYQGLFSRGEFNFQSSLTEDEDKRRQGHIQTNFKYDVTDNWRLSGEYFHTISDTYFRRYSILNMDESQSFLTSHLTGEYYGSRMQGRASLYGFQSLIDGVKSSSIPVVLPVFNLRYNSKAINDHNGIFFTEASGAFIDDRTHFKSNRLSLIEGINLPYRTSFGLQTELEGSIRMDGYSLNSGDAGIATRQSNDSYWAGRLLPQAIFKMSYPLVRSDENFRQILEPIVMLIASPNGSNASKIPNVDSQVFDFNDVNLFSSNRYTGADRVESGSRANYGVEWSLYPHKGGPSIQALLGQSFNLGNDHDLDDAMGYKKHFSNYVGRLKVAFKYLTMAYRFRVAQDNFKAHKHDVSLSVGHNPLKLGVNYLFQDSYTLGNIKSYEKKEVTFWGKIQLTKHFSAEGRYRYSLLPTNRGPLETSAILRYDNECTALELVGTKSYTHDRNYNGGTSVTVRLYLKTLGGIGQ